MTHEWSYKSLLIRKSNSEPKMMFKRIALPSSGTHVDFNEGHIQGTHIDDTWGTQIKSQKF